MLAIGETKPYRDILLKTGLVDHITAHAMESRHSQSISSISSPNLGLGCLHCFSLPAQPHTIEGIPNNCMPCINLGCYI
jgi:hypothetical protein